MPHPERELIDEVDIPVPSDSSGAAVTRACFNTDLTRDFHEMGHISAELYDQTRYSGRVG